jgi:hypothetical protein
MAMSIGGVELTLLIMVSEKCDGSGLRIGVTLEDCTSAGGGVVSSMAVVLTGRRGL